MTANVLRQVEADGVVFYSNDLYSPSNRQKYIDVFESMQADGLIRGGFNDVKWMCYSGVKWFGVDFRFDEVKYSSHIGKEFGISAQKMADMLRCFAVYSFGSYTLITISQKVNCVKQFITSYGNVGYQIIGDEREGLEEFLAFISTPDKLIADIFSRILIQRPGVKNQRTLAHLINYLAIENEVTELYQGALSDEDFLKWFPIFFWCRVTFIVPLRVTEMLLTPRNCITRKDGKTYLQLRRTKLKKRSQTVHYDVEKDYKGFTYQIPDTWAVSIIERYIDMTKGHERPYLFDHSKYAINRMVSLPTFNSLLADFISTYLIGNRKYDYARYATGIPEFELVTAGDSRPIAMANLFYQDVGADICRQLADHEHISTSSGYYTNVSNTVLCASIMQLQRKINRGYRETDKYERQYSVDIARRADSKHSGSVCLSDKQPLITGNVEDCIRENHIHECLGCRYYYPSEEELRASVEKRKHALDEASKNVVESLSDPKRAREGGADLGKVFLDAHSSIVRFRTVSDLKAKEAERKWRRITRTQKTSC